MVGAFFCRLHKRPFVRNLLLVMSGTVVAQLIAVAFLPLLSRIYSPAVYGVFGVCTAIVGVLGGISTLRYESAVMLPKSESDGLNVLAVAISVSGFVAVLTVPGMLLFGEPLSRFVETPQLTTWSWLLGIWMFLSAVSQSLAQWCIRMKEFRRTAAAQVVRSLVGPGVQLVAGLLGSGVTGLIAGAVVSELSVTCVLGSYVASGRRRILLRSVGLGRMWALAKEYRDFPFFMTPQGLMNSFSNSLPPFLLTYFFGPATTGHYCFGLRLIQWPMSLILGGLRQVLLQKATEVFHQEGDTFRLFRSVTLGLLGIMACAFVPFEVLAVPLISFVFGDQWITAAVYAKWLVLWFGIVFANLPASIFAMLYRKQKALLIWDASLLGSRALAIALGGRFFNALDTIILYSLVGLAFNIYLIVWMWMFLRNVGRLAVAPVSALSQTQTVSATGCSSLKQDLTTPFDV
jgi:O-antigen/teichoic acid export membrane protein